jgi:NADH pyrophosphatase NudC (nudix superfamily)
VLSGFTEQGEQVEEAAIREAWEETGVRVDPRSVRLYGTQRWPIGPGGACELTIGCHATALSDELELNPAELGD